MTATRSHIKLWIKEGQKQNARWVIIACDTFDYENYPIYVKESEEDEFWNKYPSGNMQIADEVYDLNMDINKQLAEHRAHHTPPR